MTLPVNAIQNQLSLTITKTTPLSGGDINEVYLLETSAGKLVAKVNSARRFPGMFEAEKQGLEALSATGAVRVPGVVATGSDGDTAWLVLEYITTGNPQRDFWETFGAQLAALHRCTADHFGLENDNYIGSLPQYNGRCRSAAEFHLTRRLEPQFRRARDNGYRFSTERLFKNLEGIIPPEKPALVHGDLWSGNYLVDGDGTPCLIDPATAYAHRETDVGMMHLFGGFSPELWPAYNSVFPLESGWQNRLDIWQLYYLLVHLNLFGRGYLGSVSAIVKKYS